VRHRPHNPQANGAEPRATERRRPNSIPELLRRAAPS